MRDVKSEAEEAVLAIATLDPSRQREIVDALTPDHFNHEANREIYVALVELVQGGRKPDVVALLTRLRARGKLEAAGGAAGITDLIQGPYSPSKLASYMRAVQDARRLREFARVCSVAASEARSQPEDIDGLLARTESAVRALSNPVALNDTGDVADSIGDVLRTLSARREAGQTIAGFRFGFPTVERLLSGLHKRHMTVIGARPGVGKTAIAMNIALGVTREDPTAEVLFFVLESPKEELAMRVLCQLAMVDQTRVNNGEWGPAEWGKMLDVSMRSRDIRIHICDRMSMTPAMMRSVFNTKRAEAKQRGRHIPMVIVDYLQLVKPNGSKKTDSRQQDIGQISRSLKEMAMDEDVSLLALSQLNRGIEGRDNPQPRLSDLRESGDIEQDADRVLFIHRDASQSGVQDAELTIAKARNGRLGVVKLDYYPNYTMFQEKPEQDERL